MIVCVCVCVLELQKRLTYFLTFLRKIEVLLLERNNFQGSLDDSICEDGSTDLVHFGSDCGYVSDVSEIGCKCCTNCCQDDQECDTLVWEGNLDPQVEYDYKRGGEKLSHGVFFDGS